MYDSRFCLSIRFFVWFTKESPCLTTSQIALVVADRHGREHHGVPVLDEGGPCRLLRHAARLDDELSPGERALDALHHCLVALLLVIAAHARVSRKPGPLCARRGAKCKTRGQDARAVASAD